MDDLQKAIAKIKANDKEAGRRLLVEVLEQDANNAEAWFWMAYVVRDPVRQRQALERAVALDPSNEKAQWHLDELDAPQRSRPVNTKTCPHCYSEIDARAKVCPRCQREMSVKKKQSGRENLFSLLGLIVLCCALPSLLLFLDGSDPCRQYVHEVGRVKGERWDNLDLAAYDSESIAEVEALLPRLRSAYQALNEIEVPSCGQEAHEALLRYAATSIEAHEAFVNGDRGERARLLELADQHFGVWAREYRTLNCRYNERLQCD